VRVSPEKNMDDAQTPQLTATAGVTKATATASVAKVVRNMAYG